jgi:3-keto-5-aminohexanoate cleavage enzyme
MTGTSASSRSSAHAGHVLIEAAITPLRRGAPAQSVEDMVREADECVRAGAAIVHHHHDIRLAEADAIHQLVETTRRVQELHPGVLTYTDYLAGTRAFEEHAHLWPTAEAGVLTMFAIDPGITSFPSDGEDGLPTRTYTDGLRFDEAHQMVELSKRLDVPISLGVFEPGHLRWIVSYARRAGFSPGTIVKLYFGGTRMVDRPDTAGINFGLPPTIAALDVYLSMLDGTGLPWIVSLFGDPVLESPIARAALERGGHLRVGVEDAATSDGPSNADMVAAAAALADDVGRPVAGVRNALAVLRGDSPS